MASKRILAALIGAFTAVIASAISVLAYVVIIFKEPLTSLPAVILIGGWRYVVAALFGIVGSHILLVADRYSRFSQFFLVVTFEALAGMTWGDWAPGNSPHISKFFAAVISAASWAITATIVVLARWVVNRRDAGFAA